MSVTASRRHGAPTLAPVRQAVKLSPWLNRGWRRDTTRLHPKSQIAGWKRRGAFAPRIRKRCFPTAEGAGCAGRPLFDNGYS
jgi:hypothetical protein